MTRFLWFPTAALLLLIGTLAKAQIESGDIHGIVIDTRTGIAYDTDAIRAANAAKQAQYNLVFPQAKAWLSKKEIIKAMPLLLKSVELEPRDKEANMLLSDIYMQRNRPEEALKALQPIVYTKEFVLNGVGGDLTAQMKYVLALLDTDKWEEAAALYNKSVHEPLRWDIPGYSVEKGSPQFTLPNPRFSPELADAPGLRAQAHLILGTRQPQFGLASLDQKAALPYMLDQLQQVLKSDRNSLDAQFLSAVVLGSMKRYAEARKAFAIVTKNAPRELRPEIKVAQAYFDKIEENQKYFDAQQAKRQAEQKARVQENAAR